MDKKIKLLRVESSRGKFRIGIDENIAATAQQLEAIGYRTWVPEKGTSDSMVDQQLRKLNIRYFVTNNFDDFVRLRDRPYFVLGVPKSYEGIGLGRIIEAYFMKFRATMIPGGSFVITQKFISERLK